jgi:hypothetical protein
MKSSGFFLVFCVLGAVAFAQDKTVTDTNALPDVMLNLNTYNAHFGFKNGEIDYSNEILWDVSDEDNAKYGRLGGTELDLVDTPLEFALLSYYSQPVLNIRPVQADAVLPKNNPKLADQKLGAAVLQEIKILGFLGNRDAVGRHEGILKFITDRGNVTRAEVETFYRQNVGASIAAEVDAQFNRVDFLLNNAPTNSIRGYNSVLTRDIKTGHYTLSYGGYYTNEEIREITKPTLDALLAEMGSRKTDFDQTGINQVRAQAALIPAVHIAASELTAIKQVLTRFYTEPTRNNFNAVVEKYNQHNLNGTRGRTIAIALHGTVASFNSTLGDAVLDPTRLAAQR